MNLQDLYLAELGQQNSFQQLNLLEDIEHRLFDPVGIDPDAFKSFSELVFEQGLEFEQHMLRTPDGYHL